MNEVFETLSEVFEELRSETGEREYFVQTEDAKKASRELKKKNRAFEKYLSSLSASDREFLEDYMDTVDHAHYKEEQRAYYQGLVDGIQLLDGLGIIQKRVRVKELLEKLNV
jgi:hypothetical protein